MSVLMVNTVTVVTVTYGNRASQLIQSLESAFHEGVDLAVVVDNGSQNDVASILAQKFFDRVKVIQMGINTGSAQGFAEGLKTAFNDGAEFILMLDDDNVLEAKALKTLKQGWQNNLVGNKQADLITLGFRPDHQADVAEGLSTNRMNPHPDSFFGFHIVDIPFKIWRRTPWFRRKSAMKMLPSKVLMTVAPYSGMFFHRSFLAKYGYPNPDFVLYGDDTEFSYRVTRAGGSIWLLTEARLSDLETSWSVKKRFNFIFDGFLLGEGDYRAYYCARNQAYFEEHCRKHRRSIRNINRLVFLFILKMIALKHGKLKRFKILLEAIKNGESAILGIHRNYLLT